MIAFNVAEAKSLTLTPISTVVVFNAPYILLTLPVTLSLTRITGSITVLASLLRRADTTCILLVTLSLA